eukprot:TRINITY_DN9916_c0_g1_i2.p1 TRINITY_DN9916_c0_g1~~TRINITY_DN9916_c0_g1_i2.p1  ORF type:complete len:267 (+),score=30.42 TRINITY_DN9916_c0_g1_i2:188-988(+)
MGQKERQRASKRKKAIQKRKAAPDSEGARSIRCTSYSATQSILVLGDGDFSFSRGLVGHRGTGTGVLATAFDSEALVKKKYRKFAECQAKLEAAGASLEFGVDATRLHKSLGKRCFDRIVFNFPHSGKQRVHINRMLIHDFLKSAKQHLNPAGQIHVTLLDKPPYSNWQLEESAVSLELHLFDKLGFRFKDFPGYSHVTTLADAEEVDTFEKHCRIWHFGLTRPPAGTTKKRRVQDAPSSKPAQHGHTVTSIAPPPPKPKFVVEFD